ncbi:hypothetical protein TorRG33x02_158220 [Trema orientale]|uniref:Uncharacterized protein n=1 Tax=Trema orientale TaxID=63057 RepID=A0A2P5ESE3_TREOI|nr:hypothetical protein TorRG33x02_158220 [Trema orientale]
MLKNGSNYKKKIEELTKRVKEANKKVNKLSEEKSISDAKLKNAEKESESQTKEIHRLLKIIEDNKSAKEVAINEAIEHALHAFENSNEMREKIATR